MFKLNEVPNTSKQDSIEITQNFLMQQKSIQLLTGNFSREINDVTEYDKKVIEQIVAYAISIQDIVVAIFNDKDIAELVFSKYCWQQITKCEHGHYFFYSKG